jgi:hypothetical protein
MVKEPDFLMLSILYDGKECNSCGRIFSYFAFFVPDPQTVGDGVPDVPPPP